jgi:hypothetical protein
MNFVIAAGTKYHFALSALEICLGFATIALFNFVIVKFCEEIEYLWAIVAGFLASRKGAATRTDQLLVELLFAGRTDERLAATCEGR